MGIKGSDFNRFKLTSEENSVVVNNTQKTVGYSNVVTIKVLSKWGDTRLGTGHPFIPFLCTLNAALFVENPFL